MVVSNWTYPRTRPASPLANNLVCPYFSSGWQGQGIVNTYLMPEMLRAIAYHDVGETDSAVPNCVPTNAGLISDN